MKMIRERKIENTFIGLHIQVKQIQEVTKTEINT
jgi:hypothetical protein